MQTFYPPNNNLLDLEGAHYSHVHGWVKPTGNVKGFGKKSLKQLSLEDFALLGCQSAFLLTPRKRSSQVMRRVSSEIGGAPHTSWALFFIS